MTQGSSLGPNYFNLYINDLVDNLEFFTLLFADDTNFLHSNIDLSQLERKANTEFNKAQNYWKANKLSLNMEKTNYMLFKPKNINMPTTNFELKTGDHFYKKVEEVKFLGITIPSDLKFVTHYNHVIKKMKSGLAALNLVRNILPSKTKLQIFNGLIKPHYEYNSIIWSTNLNKKQVQKIINMQKRGLRLVYSANKLCHSSALFIKSNITRFDLLFKKTTIEIFYKRHFGTLPEMLSNKLNLIEKSKNSRTNNLKIPPIYKKGDLIYEIINNWNHLPTTIKTPPDIQFKSKKRISDFIKEQYEICNIEDCSSCRVTPYENIMEQH